MSKKTWRVTAAYLLQVQAQYPPGAEYEPIRLVENPSLTGEKENPLTYYLSETEALALADRLQHAVAWVRKQAKQFKAKLDTSHIEGLDWNKPGE